MFEWWQILVLILAVVVGIVTVRFAITLDVNKWTESRRNRQLHKLRNLCTHTILEPRGSGQWTIESRFTSPSGTLMWICNRCQIQTHDERVVAMTYEQWSKDPLGWAKQEKQFVKLAGKLGLI